MEHVRRFPFFDLVWSGPEEASSLLAPPLAELCCQPAVEAGARDAGRAVYRALVAPGAPPSPPGSGQPVFPAEPERIRFEPDSGCFWIGAGSALARVDPAQGSGELWLGGRDAFLALPRARARRLISDMILAFLAREAAFSLHAALLSRDAEGVLLCAPRGSGKTTFALGLVEEGWLLHTDDYALARPADSTVLASGLRRLVHMAPDTTERFSDLVVARLGVKNITGEKEGVELARGQDDALREVPVRTILFLEKTGKAASAWRPLLPREGLPLLLKQVLALEAESRAIVRFEALTALARQACLARVETGLDLLQRRGSAARILTDLRR